MPQKKKNEISKRIIVELSIILFVVILSLFFWNSYLIYPIKLFIVLSHEISHGMMAILSGGKVDYILITNNLGGETGTSGGNKFLIASAGYLGSLIFGSLLFISGFKENFRKIFSVILGIILLLFAANSLQGSIGTISAFLFSLLFFLIPFYLPQIINSYLYKILGIISLLYVLIDIKEDIFTLIYRPSDAQYIAQITNTSATLWGIIWLIISFILIFFLFKWGIKRILS